MSLLGFSFRFILASLLFYLECSRPLLTDPCENSSAHTHTHTQRKGKVPLKFILSTLLSNFVCVLLRIV